ncbi:MAG: hypothetical protein LBK58_03475 [Prevotellaceae bacterium]|jgi:hypothetical protein|nr:hypothetical protein [Prevotellaceae bacterium]
MASGSDYIPSNDGKFLAWVEFLFTYVQSHGGTWQIPPTEVSRIVLLIANYKAAYKKAEAPNHGTGDTQAKNEARKTLEKEVRNFVKEYLANNHFISNEDRKDMGIPVHDDKPSPAPIPTDMPAGKVDFSRHRQHVLHVKAGSLTGKSKPPHVHGFEVWRKIGTDPEGKFEYVGFSSRSTFLMDYDEKLVGQTVSYRVRWMNSRNQPGPWNEDDINAVIA